MQVQRTEIAQVPIGGSKDMPLTFLHPDQLHPAALREDKAVVANQASRLCVEWVFRVSRNAKVLVEAVMSRPIEQWLCEIHVVKVKIVGWFALTVVERYTDVVLADSSSAVSVCLKHFG